MTANGISIREATPQDIDSVTAFQQAMAQQTYDSLGMSRSHYDLFEIDFVL